MCSEKNPYQVLSIDFPVHLFSTVSQKVDLGAKLLGEYYPRREERMIKSFGEEVLQSDELIFGTRVLWIANGSLQSPGLYSSVWKPIRGNDKKLERSTTYNESVTDMPWLNEKADGNGKIQNTDLENGSYTTSQWTHPYFSCTFKKWIISYTVLVYANKNLEKTRYKTETEERLVGLISADVDVSDIDINQCDTPTNSLQISAFLHTHKCDNVTSQCIFTPGYGWTRGSYKCQCRNSYYSPMASPIFNGTLVEYSWKQKIMVNSPSYEMLYVCKSCQAGCNVCVDDSPCLSHYNWAFRISLLTISVICIILTIVLAGYVYRYRKLKVIKVASPIFLCITLLGCAIMYSEMAAIFPVLEVYSCVATKWTRHMGFCITYSALLLKTWRVSLTYRVKSAHKLKLTDKQLLQWLFPILLVMAIYLGTWTISSPPEGIYISDWDNLKFRQCDFNWWDHSIAIGEFLFLLWGIRVCYNVRNAESFFNEAKHISWAIYNITIANIIMVMIHIVILPTAGPDIKYLFGFIRTQLSTTVTVILIFGPKFYRVIRGEGDTWDNRARARGVTASFSLNGVGLVHEETTDLYQENEELKEEIQKLAGQIEFMKIVHMEINNRHLKPKHGNFFSQTSTTQSPIIKSMYMKFDSTDSPGCHISPAAELVSERV
ncbi:probable G-protein coupled receptor CG31760 [Centruroides vittatus]|uniref:probable G-protein coupled receptor CG31760 n=1 Tax=Centruroides vittatus TaxID=120091 RepID=UPI003510223B